MQKIILHKVRFNPYEVKLNIKNLEKMYEVFEFSDVQFHLQWKR